MEKPTEPRWSPDGASILFYSNRGGKYEAWRIRPDGSGLEQLTRLPVPVFNPIWSPDGLRLAFNRGYIDGESLFLLDTVSRSSRQLLAPPPNSDYQWVSVSRDDRRLLLVRHEDEGDIWMMSPPR